MQDVPPIIYGRKIEGISAVLLPFCDAKGTVDWTGFDASVKRTLACGLTPAVNMDTGYANLIDEPTRQRVLTHTSRICDGVPFVAGAYVSDRPDAGFGADAYEAAIAAIHANNGTPIIFQSFGLTNQTDSQIVNSYQHFGTLCDQFLAFELGSMFAPFGKIYSLDVVRQIMQIESCKGIKHSSLNRVAEWERLWLRNETRSDFRIYTGNDLAIDMIMYGSDYLLGLSAFAPDLFQRRDQMWADQDPNFYQLNDILQYLGAFAFREPVPAYKHSAAMFLKLRGLIEQDLTHPQSPKRPDSDREVLASIVDSINIFLAS